MTTLTEPDLISLEDQVDVAGRLLSEGDGEGALALLASVTSDENAFLPARFLLAMAALKLGRLDSAVELMRDCHERWPMDGTVAEVLASLYAQAGNFEECLFMAKLGTALGGVGSLSKLIPQDFPNFDHVFYRFQEKPMLRHARTHLAKGDVSVAIEYVRQHSAMFPSDGDSHAFLATLLLRAGMANTAHDVLCSVAKNLADGGDLPARYASLYARALTAVGEFEAAREHHAKALALEPNNTNIVAARVADSTFLDADPRKAALGDEWARQFCPTPKPRQWSPIEGKLVVGYIVSAFVDPLDMAAVAAVARAHDRRRVAVVGFGTGAQSWSENAVLSGAFDKWHDISALDPATIARLFLRSGLHMIIDGAGFAAPNGLMALARLQSAIRVSWLGNSTELGTPVYDARIAAEESAATGMSLWRIGGGYPVVAALPDTTASSRTRSGINFGADARMSQLDNETIALWSSVLEAEPDAKLLLRSHDMAAGGGNIDRLVTRFGRELAAKIDIVDAKGPDEFYSSIDVALLPCRGVSPRVAAEAMACGVPPIALARNKTEGPYASFLRGTGFGTSLVARNAREFIKLATTLASSAPSRDGILTAIRNQIEASSAQRFAQSLEERAVKELSSSEGLSA